MMPTASIQPFRGSVVDINLGQANRHQEPTLLQSDGSDEAGITVPALATAAEAGVNGFLFLFNQLERTDRPDCPATVSGLR